MIITRQERIQEEFKKLIGEELAGKEKERFEKMMSILSGMIESKHCHLSKIASQIPGLINLESKIKGIQRWLNNKWVDTPTFYYPFMKRRLLKRLCATSEVRFIIDGSVVGFSCLTLMVSVLYKKKALPIIWLTKKAPKGHFPEDQHLQLLNELEKIMKDLPACRKVTLGDGEFDGERWIKALQTYGWEYVLRTSSNRRLHIQGESFQPCEVAPENSDCLTITNVTTNKKNHCHLVVNHERKYEHPIYLLTNLETAGLATKYYAYRYRIETLFKDIKSNSFQLHKSHLDDPEKFDRLLIVISLAYLWIIWLGKLVMESNQLMKWIHRSDRCDLSLFSLGLRYLSQLITNGLRFPEFINLEGD